MPVKKKKKPVQVAKNRIQDNGNGEQSPDYETAMKTLNEARDQRLQSAREEIQLVCDKYGVVVDVGPPTIHIIPREEAQAR